MKTEKYSKELYKVLKIRLVEEKLLQLFSSGKLNGTVHTSIGQEYTPVLASKYLLKDDFVTSNHRGHAHYLARFDNPKGLISELMGKITGVSGGMGGSQHIFDANFLSNGIQGGMLPIAAGVAHFNKYQSDSSISVSYIGDGTLGEGLLYETLNLAAIYDLPMLIILENNGIAQSTPFVQNFRGNLKKRIEGFGWEYRHCDSRYLDELDVIMKETIDFVRTNKKPALIEVKSYRLMSHSKGDDNRNLKEIEEIRENDLLNRLLQDENSSLCQDRVILSEEIDRMVEEILELPTLKETKFFKKPLSNRLREESTPVENVSSERYNTQIYESLKECLIRNKRSIVIGEDIQNKPDIAFFEYGGAFKVTRDLSDIFPGRVLNSPISEAALFGFASGHAIKAGRSYAEIMFGDFTTLIFDQVVQHASKFHAMFNGKVNCPVVVRTPMGGKRGYGPTHSQSLEKHFLGIDNFVVVALNHRLNPAYVYRAIDEIDSPVMVVENKILYTLDGSKKKPTSYRYNFSNQLFPALIIEPEGFQSCVTVLCYGEVLNEVEEALFELMLEFELFCDIICPTLISEIDTSLMEKSLKKTNKLLIIEEGSGFASWGSEVVSKLCASIGNNFELNRIFNDCTIPSSLVAELSLLPSRKKIVESVKNLCL